MLSGKNAIVTGARRGIGRATVEVFARHGANVWACARTKSSEFEDDMEGIAGRYGVQIWPVFFDVTDYDQVKLAIKEISRQKRPIHALVNVAGIVGESTAFWMTSMDKMRQLMEVNFFAATFFTQYVSRIMAKQRQGSIVSISSIAGLDGTPAQYEYAASKAAMIGGIKNLARELADYNIRVNAVAPGMISTEMGAKIEEDLRNQMLTKMIIKRMGTPEEVAGVAAFLASDLSSFMTGQVLRVDGGI